MSDLMTKAVIGMPYDLAMASEVSRQQFYDRAQALLKDNARLDETASMRAIRSLRADCKNLLVERNALASLLKRFVDGEHDQDENQAERHMYHDEAQTLLAYLGAVVQGHTLVPDYALRTQREQIQKLTADEQEAADLCERLSDLLRNTAVEVRGPEEPLKRHGFSDLPSRVKTVVAEREKLKTENETLAAAAQALRDEWRKDQADAERYRWLRDPDNQEDLEPDSDYLMPPIICGYAEHEDILSMESLDKAIDAAMNKESDATPSTNTENVSRHEGGQT